MSFETSLEIDNTPESYPIGWVSREDLIDCLPDREEDILLLDDMEVAHLARKVGEALQESYWTVLGEVLERYLEHKNADKKIE
jgi:hypothetical protein